MSLARLVSFLVSYVLHTGSTPVTSTLRNFATFSLGTRPNARRAERRGSQGIEPKNPTARKKKRKRICPKVDGSFQLFGQMPLFLRNCRFATVFRLSVCLKSNSAMVQSNSFPFVQNILFDWSKRVSASSAPLSWRDNFLSAHRRQCRWKQVYQVLRKLRFVPFQDFGRMFAMSGLAPFPTLQLASTFFPSSSRKYF